MTSDHIGLSCFEQIEAFRHAPESVVQVVGTWAVCLSVTHTLTSIQRDLIRSQLAADSAYPSRT